MMRIKVKVIANSSKDEISKISSDQFKVHLKEKAIKGKANAALIELLAEEFKCKKSQISIIKGLTSNIKIIEILA
jgi:hypothetical protein